jgi:hypothetical protein
VGNRFVTVVLALALTSSAAIFAQSVKQPETAKGHAGFSARDLSGVWLGRADAASLSVKEPPMQPWAAAKFNAMKPGYGPRATADSQDPISKCLPPGVPRIMLIFNLMQIVQIPGQVTMMFEYDHFVRHIYMVQEHPKEDSPWMGNSIGRWEGDTLVVDTTGMNDKTWLDQVGHPHSDALHVIERIRRVDHDTLQDDITIDDPKAYTKPWSGQQIFKLKPRWHLQEFICEDTMPEIYK